MGTAGQGEAHQVVILTVRFLCPKCDNAVTVRVDNAKEGKTHGVTASCSRHLRFTAMQEEGSYLKTERSNA